MLASPAKMRLFFEVFKQCGGPTFLYYIWILKPWNEKFKLRTELCTWSRIAIFTIFSLGWDCDWKWFVVLIVFPSAVVASLGIPAHQTSENSFLCTVAKSFALSCENEQSWQWNGKKEPWSEIFFLDACAHFSSLGIAQHNIPIPTLLSKKWVSKYQRKKFGLFQFSCRKSDIRKNFLVIFTLKIQSNL